MAQYRKNVQSTVFTHFWKTIKLTDHLDKNEEDNTDALSELDVLTETWITYEVKGSVHILWLPDQICVYL